MVRVKATTLCHSDVTTTLGGFGPVFPVVPGHEAISVVEEVGPDAASYGIKVGDTIGAGLWQDSCLACPDCKTSGASFCITKKILGITMPGYFAEYAVVDANTAVVVARAGEEPAESPTDLGPIFCAGITVWDALERAEVRMGETIAVIGMGGLGAMAGQYAEKLGARVIALDVRDEQLLAVKKEGGADEIINTTDLPLQELQLKIAQLNGGQLLNKVIVTSGAGPAYATAMGIVGAEGTVVAVGLPNEPIPINLLPFALRCNK